MPSRILKESICTSESLAYLSAEAEVLFYRLIVKADDFGLYYGSPKILASLLFPLNVPTEKKVSSWLAELVNGGLVATYRAEDGRQSKRSATWNANFNRSQKFKTWSIPWTPVRNASFLPCTTLTGHTTKRPNSFKSKGQPSIDKEKSP